MCWPHLFRRPIPTADQVRGIFSGFLLKHLSKREPLEAFVEKRTARRIRPARNAPAAKFWYLTDGSTVRAQKGESNRHPLFCARSFPKTGSTHGSSPTAGLFGR